MKKISEPETYNARIKIDYSKNKPQVSFKYPNKKLQTRGSMFIFISFIWIIIVLIGHTGYNLETYLSFEEIMHGKTTMQKYVECSALYPNQSLTNYSNVRDNLCNEILKGNRLRNILAILILCAVFFLPPTVIYFPFKKKWNKVYPEVNAFLARKKLKIFRAKDVKEDLYNEKEFKYFVELPVFSNIVCDYKATKDFTKYMKEFEIQEYKFSYLRKKRIKTGKKKKKYREINEGIWYARWYFNKKPNQGYLRVVFK